MWDVITHPCICFSDGYWRWSDGVMCDYIRLFYTDVITFLYPIPHAGLANLLMKPLQWRHNEHDGVSNYRRLDCLLSRLFRLTSKKTSKLSVTGLCEGIHRWPKRASNAKNVSIWWRHYGGSKCFIYLHTSVSVHQQILYTDRHVNVRFPLQWRHNGLDSVSNHQPHDCLLNRLFRRRSKKTSKLRVTGLCVGNSTVAGEFPGQMASNAQNVSIWWRHHVWRLLVSNTFSRKHHSKSSTRSCKISGHFECTDQTNFVK